MQKANEQEQIPEMLPALNETSTSFSSDKEDQWGVFMRLPIADDRRAAILDLLKKSTESRENAPVSQK